MLVFGSALYGSAEDVHDGYILNAGTNISVTKDETTKTITISTDGVATSAEVDAVKTDVQNNQTAIAANTGKIADNSTEIANNKIGINQTSKDRIDRSHPVPFLAKTVLDIIHRAPNIISLCILLSVMNRKCNF